MFPYPSGDKLHVGHWYNFAPADSYGRYMRMKGFNVFTNQDEPVGHLIFEDGLVTSYNCEQIEEPTYNVIVVGKSTIDDIMDSESPIKALNEKLGNKEIDLNGVTFGKQFKGFITKLSLSIASIFM